MIHNNIRTILVTGASSGIGKEFCKQLAKPGINLILVARREERLLELKRQFNPSITKMHSVIADLSTIHGIAHVQDVIRQSSPVDLLINNAGSSAYGRFSDSSLAAQISIARVQIEATLSLTRTVLPFMREQNFGRIINVSSIGAFISLKKTAVYAASKAFLSSFSRSLSEEEADHDIKVQCLCPGMTRTEIHDPATFSDFDKSRVPDKLWMTPDAVVSASLEALESEKLFVIPGEENIEAASRGVTELMELIQ